MMAAAGCGSATAAAIGGQVGTAAPRGRFPGRPWSSRSRLRSEKRWQLDRSGAEADDVTNAGGPRPTSLVLSLNEDQSHLRLLGIESNHKSLAEAGYSSSGSEEGDDFTGFESDRKGYKGPVRSRHNPSKSDPVQTKSKRIREKPSLVVTPKETEGSPTPEEDAPSSQEVHCAIPPHAVPSKDGRKGSKNKHSNPAKEKRPAKNGVALTPRITIKLVAKKTVRKEKGGHLKSVEKLKVKGLHFQSKANDVKGDQISSAHVKLKTETQADEAQHLNGTEDEGGGGAIPARRRGRSASKITEPCVQSGAKIGEVDDQKSEGGIKSTGKQDIALESGNAAPKTDIKKFKRKERTTEVSTEVNKLVIRRSRTTNPPSETHEGLVTESKNQSNEKVCLAESLLEVSRIEEAKPPPRKSKRKQSKAHQEEKMVTEIHVPLATEPKKPIVESNDGLAFKNDDDIIGIPSFKLIKIRNPKLEGSSRSDSKGSSRKKKRSKFVWTLTLVKGKIKDTQVQGSGNTVKGTEKQRSTTELDKDSLFEPSVIKSVENPEEREATSFTTSRDAEHTHNEKSSKKKTKETLSLEEKSSLHVEVGQVTQPHPEEATQTDCGDTVAKVVPPLQIKKVSSPGKPKRSKPSFLIHQTSPAPEEKKILVNTKDSSEILEENVFLSDTNAVPTPKARRRRLAKMSTPRKKRGSHKPWTTHKHKLQSSPNVEHPSDVPASEAEPQINEVLKTDEVETSVSKPRRRRSSSVPVRKRPGKTQMLPEPTESPNTELAPSEPQTEVSTLSVVSKPRRRNSTLSIRNKSKIPTSSETPVIEMAPFEQQTEEVSTLSVVSKPRRRTSSLSIRKKSRKTPSSETPITEMAPFEPQTEEVSTLSVVSKPRSASSLSIRKKSRKTPTSSETQITEMAPFEPQTEEVSTLSVVSKPRSASSLSIRKKSRKTPTSSETPITEMAPFEPQTEEVSTLSVVSKPRSASSLSIKKKSRKTPTSSETPITEMAPFEPQTEEVSTLSVVSKPRSASSLSIRKKSRKTPTSSETPITEMAPFEPQTEEVSTLSVVSKPRRASSLSIRKKSRKTPTSSETPITEMAPFEPQTEEVSTLSVVSKPRSASSLSIRKKSRKTPTSSETPITEMAPFEPQTEEVSTLSVVSKPRRASSLSIRKKSRKTPTSSETPITEMAPFEPQTEEISTLSVVSKSRRRRNLSLSIRKKSKTSTSSATPNIEVARSETLTLADTQPVVKVDQETQSIESGKVLLLEPPVIEKTEPRRHRSLFKHGKKKQRALIGQRQKQTQRPRGRKSDESKSPESKVPETVEEVDLKEVFSPEAASIPARSKLIGILKTKYRRKKVPNSRLQFLGTKRPRARPKTLSKQVEVDLAQHILEEQDIQDTVDDEPQSDAFDEQHGKSKYLKNIKHFIMPVVSVRSSRVIKTPQRFMDDAGMSVLPRRNSPKKGQLFGLHPRTGRKREDGTGRELTPDLPVDEEEFLNEAQLDVDMFSTQELEQETTDVSDCLSSGKPSGKRKSLLRNPSFKWHVPGESGEEVYTLDKTLQSKYETLLLSKEFQIASDQSTESQEVQKKRPCRFNKQTSHLNMYKRLKKLQPGLPKKRRKNVMTDGVCNTLQSSVHMLAEGLDDEVKSICLKKHTTITAPSKPKSKQGKSKLKIEDLDSPGVVRKVSVCVRTMNSKFLTFQYGEREELTEEDKTNAENVIAEARKLEPQELHLNMIAEPDRAAAEEKGATQRVRFTGANKRMFNLLKKAKVQLNKIDQQKQLKSSGLLSGPAGSRDAAGKRQRRKPKEQLEPVASNMTDPPLSQEFRRAGGPRIKHVCRAAAVVLGQPRALVPEDMIPRLSALPLHERTGISPSGKNQGGRSPSGPDSPGLPDQKVTKVRKSGAGFAKQKSLGPFGLRSRRCGICKGCNHEEDCGECMNCLDKPKFGGPNTKRQCCIYKRCDQIEDRKARRLSGKFPGGPGNRRRHSLSVGQSSNEEVDGMEVGDSQSPSVRKQPRRCVKPRSYFDLLDYDSDLEITVGSNSASPGRRRGPGPRIQDFVSLDGFLGDLSDDGLRHRRLHHRVPPCRRKTDKNPMEQMPPSVLAALANGFDQREREPSEPTHKIGVDFKEDCDLQNVWMMGGLSILTSVPIMPPCVCLLCASKGQQEQMLYCQVCCDPFHRFCLEATDRPSEENWCCRRCKCCHICGRKNKHSKPLLECDRCQNCYHPSCLGPNYPKPNRRRKAWVCMTCIRCKSCGVTPGKSWDTEWNHDKGLCPDCTKLHDQGNYCPICFKCYEDSDYDSQMMQCATCNHWVHAKCEDLTGDLYEILSSLPESVAYSCRPCSQSQPSPWRELLHMELRAGVEKVLACLLTSTLTQHLITCSQCVTLVDPDSGAEGQPACDLRAVGKKFDKGLYTTLKSFHEDVVQVVRRRLDQEESLPEDERPTAVARSYYLKLLEEVFNWFNSQDPKVWDPRSKDLPIGMLSHAVQPPTTEHVYAQWREREELRSRAPLGSLQTENVPRLEVKQEEVPHPTTPLISEPTRGLHFRKNRAFRLNKLKGKRGRAGRQSMSEGRPFKSEGRLSKADLDTGWSKDDGRQCSLCQKYGDAKSNEAGRLLYLGQNEWAHINCSMWSAEVFEEDNGSLMHVHSAVARGRFMRCERCNHTGATVGCCLTSCQSNYHFMCARSRNCVFQDDKKVYCYKHRDLISDKIITGQGFEVNRRMYVDFDGISLRRKFLTGLEPENINLMIGSLQIEKLGMLTELSAKQGKLFPVGYRCSRWYWSTVNPLRRCKYTCTIREVRPPVPEKPAEEMPDKGENSTIAHSPCAQSESDAQEVDVAHSRPTTPSFSAPLPKPDQGARPKIRRPAGGLFRPLPSPGATKSKPHHILTISDLEETRRPRRHSPHSQTRRDMSSPPLGSPTGSGLITLRTGGSMHPKASVPTSPLFPLGATDILLTSPSARPVGGRSASSARCPGNMTHSTSGLFPQPPWEDSVGSFPCLSLSPTVQHSPRPRLSFDLNQSDSVEVPHNFLASPEPEDNPAPNSASPLRGSFTQFHEDSDVALVSELKTELEIEETLVNEGVAMNCGAQIDVEGDDNQEEFWEPEVRKRKTRTALTRSAASTRQDWGNTSSDEDMEHYFDFSHTVVSRTGARDPPQAPASPSSRSIPQLDGVDDGTESDASVTTTDGAQKLKSASQVQNPAQTHAPPEVKITTNGLSADPGSPVPDQSPLSNPFKSTTRVFLPATKPPPAYRPHDPSKAFNATQLARTELDSVTLAPTEILPEARRPAAVDPSTTYSPADVNTTPLQLYTFPTPVEQKNSVPSLDSHKPVLIAPLQGTLLDFVHTKVPDTVYPEDLFQVSGLDFVPGAPLVLESCDPPSPSTCFTELLPVQVDAPMETHQPQDPKDLFLDSNSGHFVSPTDGSAIYMNHLTESSRDPSLSSSQGTLLELLQPSSLISSDFPNPSVAQMNPLQMSPSVQSSLPGFNTSRPPLSSISLQPLTSSQGSTVLPPMETFCTKLSAPIPDSALPHLSSQIDPILSATSSVRLPSYGSVSLPIFSTQSQAMVSTAITIVSSSPSVSSLSDALSTQCHPMLSSLQHSSAPVMINGYSSTSLQKEAAMGHTISINFSTPRPPLEPQQPVLTQGLPGHAILTVKEVGGPNVDPTPHVLLVNRLGQIFVKNPESNTFQLPSQSCPSYNCVTQIASLLQSNALSATLAAAGTMSTPVTGTAMPTHVPRMATPVVQNPGTITQLLTHNSNGTVAATAVKKPRKNASVSADGAIPGMKKPRKKKEPSTTSKREKSDKAADLFEFAGQDGSSSMTKTESAQAIINQAMASNYTPNRTGPRILSPSTFRNNPSLKSVVLPPGLLIEPELAAPTLSVSTPRPSRAHVRMKRVSSLSDRIGATKKSKTDFLEPEPPSAKEDLSVPKDSFAAVSSRAGGVRIKTPTVKGVLDLDKLKEEHLSDSECTRPGPWDRLSIPRFGGDMGKQNWDTVGRSALTDWNKYSGAVSCSDDELLPSDEDDECPPSRDQPHLRFEIKSDDGFSVEADSIEVAWRAVIDCVQEARAGARLRQLSFSGMTGVRMLGLLHDTVVFLVEQLQGARRCHSHAFRFFKQISQEEDLPVNPSGCARSEVYLRKSTFDMFNFLASQHRQLPDINPYDEEEDEVPLKSTRRATSLELPMAMRFRHLERTSKEAVGVYRSAIHGRGLFCKRNIDAQEMVIEYAGIVIRSVLTDKREKYYDGKGIGCYMFRIDDFDVVDATMHGNAARFINHSCEPNCYSRVINVEGQKHIVIFALRKIYRGEELTYDYKFPIEDPASKLNCNCGARKCRRFLN
ncbi:histone-lysine N-methyltransferase 2A-like isoform X3 [Oncorhynchus nerka]|uniref:histone-lysine N-methyltransferase 2A-like isoform X3 n=1 Tax=Oncorhynchus nerka TaxID=8023 RepID=UPI0031B8AAF6